MKKLRTPALLALLSCVSPAFSAEAAPRLTGKPTAFRKDGKVHIEFAVDRETDVAVFVEDGAGKIVRHLAAGVLGNPSTGSGRGTPPKPFKPGLSQTLVWDGTDDIGRKLPRGRYRARVCVGLQPTYAGTAFSEDSGPDNLDNVSGLATAPDGRLLVLSRRWMRYVWYSSGVQVFRRDGCYERSIKPFPPNLPLDRVKALGAFCDKTGQVNPVIHQLMNFSVYPYDDVPHQQMCATPEGHLAIVVADWNWQDRRKGARPRLAVIDRDGGCPYASYAGEVLSDQYVARAPRLALGSDGRTVYLTGLRRTTGKPPLAAVPAVFKTTLPKRGTAKVFFGDPGKTGKGQSNLAAPRGIAVDGKGHLLVADAGNDRVVVLSEKDGAYVGEFKAPAVGWLGVHPETGAVYVQISDGLIKYSGWKNARELYRLQLPETSNLEGGARGASWFFALDPGPERPLIWIGRGRRSRSRVKHPLLRCEDIPRLKKFGRVYPAVYYHPPYLWNVTVGPFRREVVCKVGTGHRRGQDQHLVIMDEATGRKRVVRGIDEAEGGQTYRLGPDGLIYGLDAWRNYGIRRFDRNGRPVKFEHATTDEQSKSQGRLAGHSCSGTTFWERDFYVDRRGDIYAKNRHKVYHGLMSVDVWGSDGRYKRRALAVSCDGALGPRVDPQGNIYMAECIKPKGMPYPRELVNRVPPAAEGEYAWMYGSVVKFGPAGGAVWYPGSRGEEWRKHFAEKPTVAAGLATEDVSAALGSRRWKPRRELPALLQGAKWRHYGFAFLADMHGVGGHAGCHCTATDFDVDDFGRVFYPDMGRFRVSVLDTAGNVIAHIGSYGNQDNWGPDSYVLDPQTGRYRRRLPADPPDLASPFAEPKIPIGVTVGLAVSDRYLYVADAVNRRILRVKLDYAAEETCSVR